MENPYMIKVAIVEDEQSEADILSENIIRFGKENNLEFEFNYFKNAVIFLTNYKPIYDVVFMDIEMPHLNGMEAARKFREVDDVTMLIFVTNVAHMAAHGYEVDAFDYIIKPVSYSSLTLKLKRACRKLDSVNDKKVILSSAGTRICLSANDITYVEVADHKLIYHTEDGEYNSYGTMSKAVEQLGSESFSLCNNCYLVNLRYVKKIEKYTAFVGNEELLISHPRKKAFMDALNKYIGA